MKKGIGLKESSGNVFADIGLPNADERLIKAQLVTKIDGLMKACGLKQW
jgi:predicted XRE-type DNA-binding protein